MILQPLRQHSSFSLWNSREEWESLRPLWSEPQAWSLHISELALRQPWQQSASSSGSQHLKRQALVLENWSVRNADPWACKLVQLLWTLIQQSQQSSQFRNLCQKGRYSLGQKYTQNLSPRHVAEDDASGRGVNPAPGSEDTNLTLGFWLFFPGCSTIILASAPTQAWAVSGTFYNGWNSAQRVISCFVVLLFQYKCHGSSHRGVTMVGVKFISILMSCVWRTLWKLFFSSEYFYQSILVQTAALFCAFPHQITQECMVGGLSCPCNHHFGVTGWEILQSLYDIRNWAREEDRPVFHQIQEKKKNLQFFFFNTYDADDSNTSKLNRELYTYILCES